MRTRLREHVFGGCFICLMGDLKTKVFREGGTARFLLGLVVWVGGNVTGVCC